MENNNFVISKTEVKKARVDRALKKQRIKMFFWIAGVIVAVGGGITGGILWNKSRIKNLPGIAIPDEGREHVGSGHGHEYHSNPPTSGPHFANPADWGVYDKELPDETLIHNLEHGGIWISYKPEILGETRKKLEHFYETYGRKIIVTPRARNDADIALAAWGRLDTFGVSDYSDERVEQFIKAFRNKGPEFVP